jgi:hypothetical protein
MEGTLILKQLIIKNNYAISYNLKEAYNHIPIHPTIQNLVIMVIVISTITKGLLLLTIILIIIYRCYLM